MGSNTIIRRKYRSNLVTMVIIVIAIIGALISEIYQAPIRQGVNLNKHLVVLGNVKYQEIVQIVVQNKLGTIALARNSSNDNLWELTSPRHLPANQQPINDLIDSLRQVNVKKQYKHDSINMTNFSIEKPLAALTITKRTGEKFILKQGIINPINNSTYISISGHKKILHIDALKFSPNSLDVSGLINPSIFALKPSSVTAIKVSKVKRKIETTQFDISHVKERWLDRKKRELNTPAINDYIKDLISIHSQIILDSVDDKQLQAVNKKLNDPMYKVELILRGDMAITYTISNPIRSFPGLNVNKWKKVIIKASNRPQIYLLDREKLNIFSKKTNQFKPPSIKKLFY